MKTLERQLRHSNAGALERCKILTPAYKVGLVMLFMLIQKVCVAPFFPVSFFNGEFAKTQRVIRGGSWNNKPNSLRSAYCNNNTSDNRNNNIGLSACNTQSCFIYG